MKNFISKADMPVLAANELANFEALWQLKLVVEAWLSRIDKRLRYKQGG